MRRQAIVLAGGLGTRLRQVVSDIPKSMAPIGDRPFLEVLLCSLRDMGFDSVVLSLGYLADKVIAHFGDVFAGMRLFYEVEESPLGTGGAARRALSRCAADHVYVFNGDTYLDLEVEKVERQWRARRRPIIVGRLVQDTSRYGRLSVDKQRVVGFVEKGMAGPGLINAGCYVFPRTLLAELKVTEPFSLETDFLYEAVTRERFDLFVSYGFFIDIGVPEEYARAQVALEGVGR